MKKYVVKCSGFEIRQMKKAGKAVLKLSGVKSVHVELEDRKLTVIGTVDPSDVLSKLERIGKNKGHAELVSPVEDYEELETAKEESEKKKVEEEIQAKQRKRDKIFKILSNSVASLFTSEDGDSVDSGQDSEASDMDDDDVGGD